MSKFRILESEAEHEEKEESGSTASESIDPVATHSEEQSANVTHAESNRVQRLPHL